MNDIVQQPTGGALVVKESQLEGFSGQGMEEANATDFAIPFLQVLQKLSPQLDETRAEYLKDAKPGHVHETATNALYDGKAGFTVIPCAFKKDLVQWKDRSSGGGFVAAHGWNEALIAQAKRNEKGQLVLPNGDTLTETKYHYVLVVTKEGILMPAVISMISTQLKKSRKWLSIMNMRRMTGANGKVFTPPSFAYFYKLNTVPESNDKGSWYGWNIELGERVESSEMLHEAIKFHKAIVAGNVKLTDPNAALGDDDIPF